MSPSRHSHIAFRRPALLIAGGGPAGLAVLLAAHRHGQLDALLSRGVVLVEQGTTIGAGDLGRYAISSDSTGRTFVDCLDGPEGSPIAALRAHPIARAVAAAADGPIPLELAGHFLALVGEAMAAILDAHPNCRLLTGHRVLSARQHPEGWRVRLAGPDGDETLVGCRHLVSATGAEQPGGRLRTESVAGTPLAGYADRLLQSGDVLVSGGLRTVADRLRHVAEPSVAIVGGSTSAVSVAHAVLNRLSGVNLGAGAVTLLHRRPLRLTYASEAEARADGYDAFGPDDICPVSLRVFRLGGFRLTQRELVMRASGIGGRPAEPRLRLHLLSTPDLPSQPVDDEARRILDRATVVVAALGYRPRALRLHDVFGTPIALRAETEPGARLVDRECRIIAADGTPVERAFAIGLAAGFVPDGALGGEASFVGQANGLWLWQNDVGLLIVSAILADRPIETVVARSPALEPAR